MDNVINMGEFIGAATGDKRHMLGKFLYFSLSNLLVEKEELSALCESMAFPTPAAPGFLSAMHSAPPQAISGSGFRSQ